MKFDPTNMFEISRHDLITTQTGVRSIAGQPVGLRTAKNLPGAAEIKRQVSNNARLRLGPKDWDAPEGDEEQADDLVATTLTTIVRNEEETRRGDGDSLPSSKRYVEMWVLVYCCGTDVLMTF